MIAGIFLLAAVLVAAAVAGLVGAVMLVPTDLGFAYLQAGSILIGASAIVMAIGFAARALDRRLASLARLVEARSVTPEGAAEGPAATSPEPETFSGASTVAPVAAGAATAAIAAAGATLAATSLLRERDDAPPAQVPPPEVPSPEALPLSAIAADLPDSDPFHDILKDASEAAAEPASDEKAMEETELAEPGMPVQEPPPFEPPLFDLPPFELPSVEMPLPVNLDAIRDEVDDAAAQISLTEPVSDSGAAESESVAAAASVDAPGEHGHLEMPVEMPVEMPPAVPSSTPGLIADADLAAIAEDTGPPLAPLDLLTAVGSYDSGGTRFTMYSDGSVVAQGPEGERRFRTLEELRRHIGGV